MLAAFIPKVGYKGRLSLMLATFVPKVGYKDCLSLMLAAFIPKVSYRGLSHARCAYTKGRLQRLSVTEC